MQGVLANDPHIVDRTVEILDNGGKSIIHGRRITAHPRPWGYDFEVSYPQG